MSTAGVLWSEAGLPFRKAWMLLVIAEAIKQSPCKWTDAQWWLYLLHLSTDPLIANALIGGMQLEYRFI